MRTCFYNAFRLEFDALVDAAAPERSAEGDEQTELEALDGSA